MFLCAGREGEEDKQWEKLCCWRRRLVVPGERDEKQDSKQDAKLHCWQRLKVPKPTVSAAVPDMERESIEGQDSESVPKLSTTKVEVKVKKADDIVVQNLEDKDQLAADQVARPSTPIRRLIQPELEPEPEPARPLPDAPAPETAAHPSTLKQRESPALDMER
jgi:hypothetical protein